MIRRRARLAHLATRLITSLALVMVATASIGPSASSAVPCADPPAVVPTADIVPGAAGSGVTALDGTMPVPFTFRVVGTIPDGWMLDLDAIVIQITGPPSFLSQAHGVFFGMSGSPAYIGGRLAGAVSGVFYDDPTYGVLTPAASMLSLIEDGTASAADVARRIESTTQIRRAIALERGVATSEVTGVFRQLPVMLGVSGLPSSALDELQGRLDERGENVRVYSAGAADIGGEIQPIAFQPGQPLGAALSYGDVSYFATGTSTFVCGDSVVAFGHPLFYDAPGTVSLGLAGATGLMVIGSGLFPGSRFANLTEPRGQVVTDSLVGIAGVVGQAPPVVPITSDLTSLDLGRSRHGVTEVLHSWGYWIVDMVSSHVWANVGAVAGNFGPGTTALDWTIEGMREDGSPFTVSNHGIVASPYGAGEVAYVLGEQLSALQFNGFEELSLTDISITGTTTRDQLVAEIGQVRLSSPVDPRLQPRGVVRARPGDRVRVEVELDPVDTEAEHVVVSLTVVIPRHGRSSYAMRLGAGTGWSSDHRIRSVDELLAALDGGTHPDDLVLQGVRGAKVRRQAFVITGRDRFTIDVVSR